MKYIITEHGNFAIFSEGLETHSKIASRVFGEVVGAGFCRVETWQDETVVKYYGESISLGIKSRPDDGDIITRKINGDDY